MRTILAAIYEPLFSQHSHGFRPGRSCHTALEGIRNNWTGVKWLIEVDVRGFFDNIDHDILLKLIARRIDDPRFVGLIEQMLKAGCLDDWVFERTYSGTPQGGVVSPILANIYLHELDMFMAEMKAGFDRGHEATRASGLCSPGVSRIAASAVRSTPSAPMARMSTVIRACMKRIKAVETERRAVPSVDPMDPTSAACAIAAMPTTS